MTRVVAVSGVVRTDGGRERVAVNSAYVRAMIAAGLIPVVVPPLIDPASAGELVDQVAGVLLTGGEDVRPERYGATPHPKLGRTDPARDAVEAALIAAARQRGRPILAICRGIQILNVALGGTLYQDLPSERPSPVDHTDESGRHALRVEPGSLMARTLGRTSDSVNSRHHQAVRDLAPGLVATAWADDGIVEGAEEPASSGHWTLAVQWHPEDDGERALFHGFAEALR